MAVACAPADSPLHGHTQLGIQATNGITTNGITTNGITTNGITTNGITTNGITTNGITTNGITTNSLHFNGLSLSCNALDGLCVNGTSIADASLHGLHVNRDGSQGLRLNGISLSGAAPADIVAGLPGDRDNGLYGFSIDGLYIDGVSPGSVSINGLGLAGMSLRGLDGSGLKINSDGINGVGINRRDGARLGNGIAFRGVNANLLGTAGDTRPGVGLIGVGISGLFLDGHQVNSLSIDGVSPLDVALDGLTFNGAGSTGVLLIDETGEPVALQPQQEFIAHAVLFYLVGCALPEGEFATITASDGTVNRFPGLRGYAPEWQYGALSQLGAENVRACVGSSLTAFENAMLTDEDQARLDHVLVHLVACALPADDEITVVQSNSATKTYRGRHGLAAEWATGPLHPASEARVRACLESAPGAEIGRPLDEDQETRLDIVLRYALECALADDQSVTIYSSKGAAREYHGIMGLAPEWSDEALSPSGRRVVSACLAARTNPNGQSVRLSLRGASAETTAVERAVFSRHEGAFWGDAFIDQPYMKTCAASGAGFSGRVCTDGSCGYQALGACADVCASSSHEDGSYDECDSRSDVLNSYLSITTGIAFGRDHNCYREVDGSLSCWGDNKHGELGDGTTISRATPDMVTELGVEVAEVGAGAHHTCARLNDGSVSCWGSNEFGQAGHTKGADQLTAPSQVAALEHDVASLAVGRDHACALRTDGTLFCWGDNEHGQVGSDEQSAIAVPQAVVELASNVARIALGESADHSCAITLTGELWCWGRNHEGQVGDGTRSHHSVPVQVATDAHDNDFEGLTDLCTGGSHTCARDTDGQVFCWGSNDAGQLGRRATRGIDHTRPVAMALPGRAVQGGLSCAAEHTCAIVEDGSVSCWGSNRFGQLGNGSYRASGPTTVVGLDQPAVAVSADADHTCATLRDQSVWCWGHDADDRLFSGNTSSRPIALQFTETVEGHPGKPHHDSRRPRRPGRRRAGNSRRR